MEIPPKQKVQPVDRHVSEKDLDPEQAALPSNAGVAPRHGAAILTALGHFFAEMLGFPKRLVVDRRA